MLSYLPFRQAEVKPEKIVVYHFGFMVYLGGMYVCVMTEKIGRKRPLRLYLAEWREHRKLDQEQVADRMGVTAATISRHETGERGSNEAYLASLAEALDCHPTDFWRDPAQPSADDLLRDMPEDQRAQVLRIIQTFKTGT